MRVIRKSQKRFYDDARAQHEELLTDHQRHVELIEATNQDIRAKHEAVVAERAALQAQIDADAEQFYQDNLASHQERVEWWEDAQKQKERMPRLMKVISPWRDKPSVAAHIMGEPGEPPTKQDAEQLAEVPEPELLVTPQEPEFQHEEPEVFGAVDVTEEPLEVKTPWGIALALPGQYVLTSERTKKKHIETAETVANEYTVV